ncbi:MAG: hypothetical protein J5831_03060 [Bacteroidales bacterium]|nr:hypothetical protein [Bacteroidales bacterium]
MRIPDIDIETSRKEYDALPSNEWRKDYFNEENGGYVATSWKRIAEANKNNKELLKFDKEHEICLVFAKSGLRIQHYEDEKPDGTYDVVCNGLKGDIKKTTSTNNIFKYARWAKKQQRAEIILFEFITWNAEFRKIVDELVRKDYHGYYYVSNVGLVHRF